MYDVCTILNPNILSRKEYPGLLESRGLRELAMAAQNCRYGTQNIPLDSEL